MTGGLGDVFYCFKQNKKHSENNKTVYTRTTWCTLLLKDGAALLLCVAGVGIVAAGASTAAPPAATCPASLVTELGELKPLNILVMPLS